ncbi:unnamed protein product [Caenorhabditis angaria]|uniref:Tc1-like transposase DDE domain-containing protein n=1 Tax=Caenorhabditis angaria TaxID=860376 RepID=A0A9P1IRF5_9PELO|nr:unnamed protein product [Caenorhabditis angaria]
MVLIYKCLSGDGTDFIVPNKNEQNVLRNILPSNSVAMTLNSGGGQVVFIKFQDTVSLKDYHLNEAAQILLNFEVPMDDLMYYDTIDTTKSAEKLNKNSLGVQAFLPRKSDSCFQALMETVRTCCLKSVYVTKNGKRTFQIFLDYEDSSNPVISGLPEKTAKKSPKQKNKPLKKRQRMSSSSEENDVVEECEPSTSSVNPGSPMIDLPRTNFTITDMNLKKSEICEEDRRMISLGKKVRNLKLEKKNGNMKSRGKNINNRGEEILKHTLDKVTDLKNQLGEDAKNTIFESPVALVEYLCGVSRTVVKERKKHPKDMTETTPKRVKGQTSRKKRREKRAAKLSETDKEALRDYLDICWGQNKNVTIESLLDWAKSTLDFQYGKSFFNDVLFGMGFTKDLVIWRRKYLMRKLGLQNLPSGKQPYFAFFDETWIYEGMTSMKGWQYLETDLYKLARWVRLEERRSGPQRGKDKGKRAIVLSILTPDGILKESANVLISGLKESEQFMDYHREMNSESYREYMEEMIPKLADEAKKRNMVAVLVIDNAPYHNQVVEKIPTKGSTKQVLVDFLLKKNINVNISMKKKELLEHFEEFLENNGGRRGVTKYVIDEFAKLHGVEILRLPPYHCMFNPIELVWAQLKTFLRSKSDGDDDLASLRQKAIDWLYDFTPEQAQNCIRHAENLENETRRLIEEQVQEAEERERQNAYLTTLDEYDSYDDFGTECDSDEDFEDYLSENSISSADHARYTDSSDEEMVQEI